MAFSFGGATPSTPSFGFGATTPAFGAPAPTPAPASTPGFGFGSAPAFGTTQSTPGFGAVSTPAFAPAAAAASFFGAQTGAAFGAAQSAPTLFGASSSPSLFGAQQQTPVSTPSTGFGFGTGALAATTTSPSLFGAPPHQAQQQQSALLTKDNRPLSHSNTWDDLSPQAQQYLLELEKIVVQFREECRQLDGSDRLQQGKDAKAGIEDGARLLSQRIAALGTSLRNDSETCEAILELVRKLERNTESALYTFKRSYLWREGVKAGQGGTLPSHLLEQLSGPVVLPSHFLKDAVAGYQENLGQYRLCCAELEQVLLQHQQQHDAGRLLGASGTVPQSDMLHSLQAALKNLHDLLIHVAAKLQLLDDRVAEAKEARLASRRQAGDYSDPFAEAERQHQQQRQQSGSKEGVKPNGSMGAASNPQQQAQPPALQQQGGTSACLSPPAAGGLFGSLTPGASPFGTPLFGGGAAGSATVRKSRSKK